MKHLLSIFSFSVILAHPYLRKVRICGTYHTITQKRLLLKLPTGIPAYSQENRNRAGNYAHPTSENGKLAFLTSGRPAFREHAKCTEGSDTTPRLARSESTAHRVKKQQHHQIANRSRSPAGPRRLRNSDAHKSIAVPKAFCVLREHTRPRPKSGKASIESPMPMRNSSKNVIESLRTRKNQARRRA